MKNILMIFMLTILTVLGVYGCQKTEQVKDVNQTPKSDELNKKSEVIRGDFIYRLVSEKEHYDEGEDVKVYAELEYIGEEDEVEITHGSSPFLFPMTETTRDYEIEYAVTLQGESTTLKKGEPVRQEIKGGGSYSNHDDEEYKVFMKRVMKQDYPSGHYVVNGYADFHLADEVKEEEKYTIEAQIEFYVESNKDVKAAAWGFLNEKGWQDQANDDLQSAKVDKVLVDHKYILLDKTYDGKEVVSVSFEDVDNAVTGTPILLVDPDTNKVIGYMLTE